MPSYCSSLPSPFSSSSDSSQRPVSIGSPNISFLDYLKLFSNNDSSSALMVALFEWQDLVVKTNEMKHLAPLVEWLQDKANQQQEHMEEIFNGMEAVGLHWILKKHFMQDNRIIRTRRGVEFNLPWSYKKYLLHCRWSTPYPPAILSKYESSSSNSLPTGDYQTISRYPLDRGFIHHYVRPAHPEPSTSIIVPKQEQIPTIQAKRSMPKVMMDWINYQGGVGSRFNPIIVEDDWFGESMGLVRGSVTIIFTYFLFSLIHCLLLHVWTIIVTFSYTIHCLNAASCYFSLVLY